MQYEIFGSAYGGGQGHDGCSMTATHLSNLHITPIEILESEFPCRVTEMSVLPDSGGAGEFRGGLAFRRRYELLQDALIVRRYEKAKYPATGTNGGMNGRKSRFVQVRKDGKEFDLPAAGRFEMRAGDSFYIDKAGGGGYGLAENRKFSSIERDIAEGYITIDEAVRTYKYKKKSDP